mgnify:CR=1 FL=1
MFLKERAFKMKNKNSAEKYFNQKDFSIIEIVLIIISVVSLIIAAVVQGGGPIGLPILLACIVGFCICRSFKIKDSEIEETLEKIIQDNKIECSENAIQCYDLKGAIIKKRKDGKFISPNYYITDISFSSEETIFDICVIDLIKQSAEKLSHKVDLKKSIILTEETVKTRAGVVKASYLKVDGGTVIPVALNDYKASQVIQKVCERHKK